MKLSKPAPIKPAIVIEGATKEYFLSRAQALAQRTHIVAVDRVDLTVATGEVVGLIGRNGAGKTSLLRAIAGTSPLDSGFIYCAEAPRVVLSLLESFLPHLTGRENIYLYGSLLGLLQVEIKLLEPAIIAFSGLDAVIDEPLRQYSAGMRSRLAFAVATAGQPGILCLDEILSVGDASFIKQTNQRLRDLARLGTTIVIASHDLQMLAEMANRLVLLEAGRVVVEGTPRAVIERYDRLLKALH